MINGDKNELRYIQPRGKMFEKEQSKIEGLQQEKTVQKGKVEG